MNKKTVLIILIILSIALMLLTGYNAYLESEIATVSFVSTNLLLNANLALSNLIESHQLTNVEKDFVSTSGESHGEFLHSESMLVLLGHANQTIKTLNVTLKAYSTNLKLLQKMSMWHNIIQPILVILTIINALVLAFISIYLKEQPKL